MSLDDPLFQFISAPEPTRTRIEEMHEEFAVGALSGILSGEIYTLTEIHVGTGQLVRPQDLSPRPTAKLDYPLIAAFFRAIGTDGRTNRIIPGSSWRGVVRNLVEMITPSAFGVAGSGLPAELRDSRFSDKQQKNNERPVFDPAGQIFGGQGYASHVRFRDVTTPDETGWPVLNLKERWTPKVRLPNDRKVYLHAAEPELGNELLEVCPPGVIWEFQIAFHNLSQAQLGLLLIALGQDPQAPLFPKLGGGKGQGIGSIRVQKVSITLDTPENAFLDYDVARSDALNEAELIDYIQIGYTLVYMPSFQQLIQMIGNLPDELRRR